MRPISDGDATATMATRTATTRRRRADGFEAGLDHFAMQDEEDVDEDV